jgi:hypothetical protein
MFQDEIDGERRRRGCPSRHYFTFNVTGIFPANYVWYFGCVPLLSCDSSCLTRIALSFKII